MLQVSYFEDSSPSRLREADSVFLGIYDNIKRLLDY